MAFKYVDLFAGIGGFHAALGALGGECVYASEIDQPAAKVYQRNWGIKPEGDITLAANDSVMEVPEHDVLVGGFPCQPFSKSGKQLGMEESRGTLFWNIAKIIEIRKPKLVLLENVRNISGPRHVHEWEVIIRTLRTLGYRVSSVPLVVSPHRISPNHGGRPQSRERVLIAATLDTGQKKHLALEPESLDLSHAFENWNPQNWNLKIDLPLESSFSKPQKEKLKLPSSDVDWIEAWNEFVEIIVKKSGHDELPGFPIWADEFVHIDKLKIPRGTPVWKKNFLQKNSEFYTKHKSELDKWLKKWNNLEDFPPSRRKLEWQAQDTKNLWSTIMHFRPSGIRAKKPTYVPALVAITQTSIVGSQKRRLSVREASRLQGFPDWFDFLDQADSLSYKQLGNAVNVGVIYNVIKAQVVRDLDLLKDSPKLTRTILSAPNNPDEILSKPSNFFGSSTLKVNKEEIPERSILKKA
jgi:DNA (cytosine-5)-methyltransferase 1